MSVPREAHFAIPHVASANLRPLFRTAICRVEEPPSRDAGIWTPFHKERERGIGFVVYGVVVRVGPGQWEPAWVRDDVTGHRVRDGRQLRPGPLGSVPVAGIKKRVEGPDGHEQVNEVPDSSKLVWVPTVVKPGDRVVWAHGWGPSLELRDGTHFWVHEDGILGTWDAVHVHCWHDERKWIACCSCDETRISLETRLPSCGAKAQGPRLAEALVGEDPMALTVDDRADPTPSVIRRLGPDEE